MLKRGVKAFLDSNVIISGLFSDKGAPRIILDILSLELPFLEGITGRYNIIEIERTIRNKMPHILPVYEEFFPKVALRIVPLPSLDEIRGFSGFVSQKDVPVLASAVKGEADFLVTGDKRLFKDIHRKGGFPFKMVSPSEMMDKVLPEIFKELDAQ